MPNPGSSATADRPFSFPGSAREQCFPQVLCLPSPKDDDNAAAVPNPDWQAEPVVFGDRENGIKNQ